MIRRPGPAHSSVTRCPTGGWTLSATLAGRTYVDWHPTRGDARGALARLVEEVGR